MGKDDFSKIPNGHPAIENRMELLYSEGVNKSKITLNKYVEIACTNPAKIFGMFPRKGTIAVGSDADIVIFDPTAVKDNATFAKPHQYASGMIHVFVNGVQVLKDGEHTDARPGRFVKGPGYKMNNQ